MSVNKTQALRALYEKISGKAAGSDVNTSTEALAAVYEAITGKKPTSTNPTKMIDALAENWSGGGGSGGDESGLSTATVTFTNTNENGVVDITNAHIIDEDEQGKYLADDCAVYSEPLDVTFVLLNGESECSLSYDHSQPVTLTGAVELDSGILIITGDGTVSAYGSDDNGDA